MGVPASVIFEGKFSSNSMSQLQLLNGTIQSIAIAVNKVLTATYHAVYSDAKEGDELVLLGQLPFQIAAPAFQPCTVR